MQQLHRIGKIYRVILQNRKASITDKKSAVAYIAFIFHPAIPLSFVFNKFNIIITLCNSSKSREK